MLIDSHHHLWAYDPEQYDWISDDMSVLQQDFLAPQLAEIAGEHGVAGFISVQARQSLLETRELLDIARREPLIDGVVGWVPLAAPDVEATIDGLVSASKLRGVRHVVQDEADDRFLDGADFNRGVGLLAGRGLVFDLLVYPHQLPAAIDFADRHPEVPMVLDHLGKPAIRAGEFDQQWERHFRQLAKREHVACKFSGLATEVRDSIWSLETMRPYWEVALETFGVNRLMYGSDWPVCLLATSYSRWLDTVRQLAAALSENERERFFASNAQRVYQIENRREDEAAK